MEKKPTSSAVMGLLVALALIVCSLVTLFGEFYTERWAQVLGFVLLFGGILISVLLHAKEVDYHATFGGYFGFGFKVTAAVTVLMIVYVVLQGYIFPEVKTTIMEMSRVEMAKNPQMSESQVDQAMQWMENNFTLMIVLSILFWYLVIGAVASLIGAAVSKKRPAHTFDNI
jgi:hypothetical protein